MSSTWLTTISRPSQPGERHTFALLFTHSPVFYNLDSPVEYLLILFILNIDFLGGLILVLIFEKEQCIGVYVHDCAFT